MANTSAATARTWAASMALSSACLVDAAEAGPVPRARCGFLREIQDATAETAMAATSSTRARAIMRVMEKPFGYCPSVAGQGIGGLIGRRTPGIGTDRLILAVRTLRPRWDLGTKARGRRRAWHGAGRMDE